MAYRNTPPSPAAPAKPRQPACTAATERPLVSASRTGKQSATMHRGTCYAGVLGETGIGHSAVRRVGMQTNTHIAVHLIQKHQGPGPQVVGQQLAVVCHGSGVILHMRPRFRPSKGGGNRHAPARVLMNACTWAGTGQSGTQPLSCGPLLPGTVGINLGIRAGQRAASV